jgi:hypothetical protein
MNDSEQQSLINDFFAPLSKILEAELKAGNEISGYDEYAFEKIERIVYLKRSFARDYTGELKDTDVVFYANYDAHYNLGESYSSASFRQAVEAPFTTGETS